MSEKIDYGKTLNLPKTSFKMKGNLPQKEPILIRDWTKAKIYEKSLDNTKPIFFLHDGPPYANGDIHVGHAINKILKDMILKYKRLSGYNVPYIPGWDTHGLPIEWKIVEELGAKAANMTPLQIREKCKKYALKSVENQKKEFIRLGILGEWDNPYISLKPEFEAEQLRVFKEIYENGYVYSGLKPVYWSPTTETALAEAEIEYKDVVSPSIYVKMELEKDALDVLEINEASIVIWTTTPWTIPANLGISLNKEFVYGIYSTDKGNLILAKELADKAFADMNISEYSLVKEFEGNILERKTYKHPIFDRTGLIILGDHVTLEAGTGCVHTAPGHGVDDYVVGQAYGLGILSPIDDKGHMTAEAGKYEGLFYKKANKIVAEDMQESGHLLALKEISHSYPHDWRSKKPVIYRATEQWFIAMDTGIRKKALEILQEVEFVPSWGRNRINAMVENRPDWTISRQRVWGVPIPLFYNEKTNEIIYHSEITDKVISLVEKEGTDIWWKYTAKEIIGEELLEKYNLKDIEIRKERSILDVWFDSGSSHRAVVVPRGYKRPVDLYLEGSDQHRGWFQSSLLTSVASTNDAPYKRVLTHGFVLDSKGTKMSKSLGNVVFPNEVIQEYGADILRLWVSSVDYREDVRIGKEILNRIVDSYKKIRNTSRYLLGNISDYTAEDAVPYDDLLEIDKWALHKLEEFKKITTKYYDKYEFYSLLQEILYFCSVDMSAFYLDIIKDRLYCEYRTSLKRRSAQTVLAEILNVLVRTISPILSFTAEEIWEKMPESLKDEESILLTSWIKEDKTHINEELSDKWEKIHELKKEINKKIEKKRQEGLIGLSLDARIVLNVSNTKYAFLAEYSDWDKADIFIVSQVALTDEVLESTELEGVTVRIEKALGEKCERCWKYGEDVGTDSEYPNVTPRDAEVLRMIAKEEQGE